LAREDSSLVGFFHEEGMHLRRGAHHHLEEVFLLEGGYFKGKDKYKEISKENKRKGKGSG
jgi:hypothetical protein